MNPMEELIKETRDAGQRERDLRIEVVDKFNEFLSSVADYIYESNSHNKRLLDAYNAAKIYVKSVENIK